MKKSVKLVLNQETLRNLTANELRKIEGGFNTQPVALCRSTVVPSCPECNPPAHQ